MSDEGDQADNGSQILTAEYKDGQLQIVEVTPIDKPDSHILPDLDSNSDGQFTVLDTNKGLMQLDLLNLTFVRCQDGDGSYQLVASTESDGGDGSSDATVTCVLQSSDNEEADNQEAYVMVEGEEGPLVFLQSSLQQPNAQKTPQKKEPLTPVEILEKAKALQKAKASVLPRRGGRKRKSDLPPPHELLALPNFKLYLYSCKHCGYKCNAVKDMSAHKAAEHGAGSKSRAGSSASSLQCARCPYRGNTHMQLMKHVQQNHGEKQELNMVRLDSDELAEADVLVCGACGFESSSRADFKVHIEDVHGATTC